MALAEIRTRLLGQHDDLRARLATARDLAIQWRAGECGRDAVRDCLRSLVDQLGRHNAYEESVLADVLPTVDAWGPERRDAMTEQHIDEHRNLCAGLLAAVTSKGAWEGAQAVLELLDSMLDHMRREERVFLGADVLTDDIAVKDYFGG